MEKKHFVKIVTSLVTVLLKMTYLFAYFAFTKKTIVLSLFEIDALTMYILMILTCPYFNELFLHH